MWSVCRLVSCYTLHPAFCDAYIVHTRPLYRICLDCTHPLRMGTTCSARSLFHKDGRLARSDTQLPPAMHAVPVPWRAITISVSSTGKDCESPTGYVRSLPDSLTSLFHDLLVFFGAPCAPLARAPLTTLPLGTAARASSCGDVSAITPDR